MHASASIFCDVKMNDARFDEDGLKCVSFKHNI